MLNLYPQPVSWPSPQVYQLLENTCSGKAVGVELEVAWILVHVQPQEVIGRLWAIIQSYKFQR